jgi:hypothetical protein
MTILKAVQPAPDEYKIERGIEIPDRARGKAKYPFAEMEVGDSFAFPVATLEKVRAACSWAGTRSNPKRKFSVRKHGSACRCWRVA